MSKQFAQQFYNSKAWHVCRAQVLRRDLYTCRDCFDRASEVHHIVELTPSNINSGLALDPDNLVSLCHACHDKVTKGSGDLVDGYYFDDDGQVKKQ